MIKKPTTDTSTQEPSSIHEMPSLNDALGTLQVELERLKSAAEHIEQSKEAAREAVEAASRVGQAAVGLTHNVGALINRLDRVDFPSRLDKIDATVSALQLGFQNVQGRLDGVERNVQETVRSAQVTTGEHVAVVGQAVSTAQRETVGLVSQHAAEQVKVLKQVRLLLFGMLGGLLILAVLALIGR